MKTIFAIASLFVLFCTATVLGHVADKASKPVATSDVRLRPENWDFSAVGKGARVDWADHARHRVNLALAANTAGQAYLISRQTVHGDFDVKVRVNLSDWEAPPGAVLRLALMAGRPEDNYSRCSYLVVREMRGSEDWAPEDNYTAWFADHGKTTFLSRQPAPLGEKRAVLRLVRRGGRLTAFHWAEGLNKSDRHESAWVEDARFEAPCAKPLHLMLGISNMAGTETKVHSVVKASFDLEIHGGRKQPSVQPIPAPMILVATDRKGNSRSAR
jgi:hypothetical protein